MQAARDTYAILERLQEDEGDRERKRGWAEAGVSSGSRHQIWGAVEHGRCGSGFFIQGNEQGKSQNMLTNA